MKVFTWKGEKDTIMTPTDSIRYYKSFLQAGLMAMEPQTGHVKAWVGGIDFKTYKYDHANQNTTRQVGSTIKPLLYALAIENGGFTPNTPVEDVQQNFEGFGLVPATNASCSNQTMPMAMALAQSRNCATAYIMKQLGSKGNDAAVRLVDFLKTLGVKTKIEPMPAICLGSGEISLYEMMQAYSMFPTNGFSVKPMYITRIEDKNGNSLQVFTSERKEVISASTAYNVVTMMQGVMRFGTGARAASYGINVSNIAGKTGTTNDNSDAWFMGYSPNLICGVWTGCDDRFIRFSSTSVGQGSSVALPVWAYFYDKCSKDKTLGLDTRSPFVKPEGMAVDTVATDWTKGVKSGEGDEQPVRGNGDEGDYGSDYGQHNSAPAPPPAKKDTARSPAALPKKPGQ